MSREGAIFLALRRFAPCAVRSSCALRHHTPLLTPQSLSQIMMSNTESPVKLSSLEQRINVEIRRIVLYLAAVCFTGAVGSFIWKHNKMLDAWYLRWTEADAEDPTQNLEVRGCARSEA